MSQRSFNQYVVPALCAIAILVVSPNSSAAPIEATWWSDMHVQATPRKTSEGAVYAIDVRFSNRSRTDMAILQESEAGASTFALSLLGPGDRANQIAVQRTPPPPAVKRPAGKRVEILPGASIAFCLSIKDALVVDAKIATGQTYRADLTITSALAWRRSAGYTTPFGYENEQQMRASKYFYGPTLFVGNFELSSFDGRRCE